VCEFFLNGWLLLWCEEVLAIIYLVFMNENPFLGLKSFLNDAMTVIMLCQTNHQYVLMKVCSHKKVEVQYCDKRSSFLGVTVRSVVIFIYFNWFPHQEGDRITTTAAVFKWEFIQHITEVCKLFEEGDFLHWRPYNSSCATKILNGNHVQSV